MSSSSTYPSTSPARSDASTMRRAKLGSLKDLAPGLDGEEAEDAITGGGGVQESKDDGDLGLSSLQRSKSPEVLWGGVANVPVEAFVDDGTGDGTADGG